jgi:hypothetical protein
MKKTVGLLTVVCSLLVAGCVSTPPFDQYAYQTAVDLKVDSLMLMSRAGEAYTNYVTEADALQLRLHKAYEYAKGKPGNDETVAQWAKMMNTNDNLFAGFIVHWEHKEQIKPAMINNAKSGVSDAYDAIIDLEAKKLEK